MYTHSIPHREKIYGIDGASRLEQYSTKLVSLG